MPDEKQNPTNGEPKVGVYICHCGGNISDTVDVAEVEDKARELPGVTVSCRNMFMCSDPGQEAIIEDLKSGKVDRVVVASCAPSLHETTFRQALERAGVNPYLYEHANIREQVSWVHHGPGATRKASELVAAAVAKARLLSPLKPIRLDAVKHTTVVGGGMAGLKAARDLARRGIPVTLVEKSPFLGGNAALLDRFFPTRDRAGDLISGLAAEVLDHTDITVLTNAEITGADGYVGDFHLKVVRRPPESSEDLERLSLVTDEDIDARRFIPFMGLCPSRPPEAEETFDLNTGAVVMATGFKHYAPRAGEFGFAEFPEVVTLPDFIHLLADAPEGGEALEVNGQPVRSVVFVHCVGSRQILGIHEPNEDGQYNEHCSRVCCTATLQAAIELKERFPETVVYDLYRDIRTYGRGHEEYYLSASRNRVLFLRYEPEALPVVSAGPGGEEGALSVRVKDTLLSGEEVDLPVDLVVLAVGMEPSDVSSLVGLLKLPVGADRFLLEVHPKLRPVEVAVGGVLLAGTCQAPMNITEATSAASAAAVKVASLLSQGEVTLDPFVARVDPSRCVGSGACVEACIREGALEMVEVEEDGRTVRRARVNPALCLGCGVCTAACPENAIEVDGWTLGQYEAMVDAIVAQG